MSIFLAEFYFFMWTGRENEERNITRIVDAKNIEEAELKAREWWKETQKKGREKAEGNGNHYFESELSAVVISEPII